MNEWMSTTQKFVEEINDLVDSLQNQWFSGD